MPFFTTIKEMDVDMEISEIKDDISRDAVKQEWNEMECQICGDVMNHPRENSCGEIPYKLPCSHVFGSRCIVRWLQISHRQDCPHCRRRMVHKGCGHLIMPHHASTAPPTIKEADTPRDCVRCRGEAQVAKIIKREHEQLLAKERSLRGMKTVLPRFFGGGQREGFGSVEERIAELRKGFEGLHDRAWREYEEKERRVRW